MLCTQVNMMYVIATLSVYPHRASLKNMPGHDGIRTYDLWNASPMLCQLSYVVRSVRVYDISVLSLVPSIPMSSNSMIRHGFRDFSDRCISLSHTHCEGGYPPPENLEI